MEKIRKILQPDVSIIGMGSFISGDRMSSEAIETKIRKESNFTEFQSNTIFQISGTYTRYFSDLHDQSSSLAAEASKKALMDANMSIDGIDCIIFASASQDVIEPATANMVQQLLGSKAPVFDIKNACNSFLNGLQVARSFLISGQYKNILVCSGETPSRAIRWSTDNISDFKDAFAGYNLGDAGTAMILSKKSPKAPRIHFSEFLSKGAYFDASTILGGGSRFPRETDKLYFRSDSRRLSDAFTEGIPEFTNSILQKNGWSLSSIHYFIPHIVSRYSKEIFLKTFPALHHQVLNCNTTHGNMASCSVPYAFIEGKEQGKFSPGDRILFVGLGAGASYGLIGIEFP